MVKCSVFFFSSAWWKLASQVSNLPYLSYLTSHIWLFQGLGRFFPSFFKWKVPSAPKERGSSSPWAHCSSPPLLSQGSMLASCWTVGAMSLFPSGREQDPWRGLSSFLLPPHWWSFIPLCSPSTAGPPQPLGTVLSPQAGRLSSPLLLPSLLFPQRSTRSLSRNLAHTY